MNRLQHDGFIEQKTSWFGYKLISHYATIQPINGNVTSDQAVESKANGNTKKSLNALTALLDTGAFEF
jgi:hypothetical protein